MQRPTCRASLAAAGLLSKEQPPLFFRIPAPSQQPRELGVVSSLNPQQALRQLSCVAHARNNCKCNNALKQWDAAAAHILAYRCHSITVRAA
jgi:hypothetical protein